MSLKTEEIAQRLWKMKKLQEDKKKHRKYDSLSTESDQDDENDTFQDDEIDQVEIHKSRDSKTTDEKPSQSYIALIATAILQSKTKRLVLSDIYNYIMVNYPYFQSQDKSWRNSVRHNLSLNECFIKVERSEQGKGHYWAIHPANYEDFSQGDFRRRRARRRIRRSFFGNHYTQSYFIRPCYRSDFMPWPPHNQYQTYYQKKHTEAEYHKQKLMKMSEFERSAEKTVQQRQVKKSSLFTIENILSSKETKKHLTDQVKQPLCACEICSYRDNQVLQQYGRYSSFKLARRGFFYPGHFV